MIVLALDTTTRAGSVALARDGVVLAVFVGDPSRTHATRLPGDLLDCLQRHHLALADVDVFAVAAGPGSFTGLRIGIATIQGLAFAQSRTVVAVSALEALAASAGPLGGDQAAGARQVVGAWMDAQRHEIYAELSRRSATGEVAVGTGVEILEPAAVGEPGAIVERWRRRLVEDPNAPWVLVGDGALAYRAVALDGLPGVRLMDPVPPLAPAIALIAGERAARGLGVPPHAVKPLYVRRPDAELARERKKTVEPPAPPIGLSPSSPDTPSTEPHE